MKSLLLLCTVLMGCLNVDNTAAATLTNTNLTKDVAILKQLHNTYTQKSLKHDDYEGIDTALFAFEKKLKAILETPSYQNKTLLKLLNANALFTVIAHNTDHLITVSWKIIDSGCHHSYKSLYRYQDKTTLKVSYLMGKANETFSSTNGPYTYEIHRIAPQSFLLLNAHLVCGSSRNLSAHIIHIKKEAQSICKDCFSGTSGFYTSVPRSDTIAFKFNPKTKTLMYPELQPLINEGEDTGFTTPTGRYKKLVYTNGKFTTL